MSSSIEVRIKEKEYSPAIVFKIDDATPLSNKFREMLFHLQMKYSALHEVLETDIDSIIVPIKINGRWYLTLKKRRYLK